LYDIQKIATVTLLLSMNQHNHICGLVLAGGKSTRMGFDKGQLFYHGMPQRVYAFELLKKYCHVVYTSCAAGEDLPLSLNPLEDALALQGPMNGLITAFRKHPHKAWIVMAVDMPYADGQAIEQLITGRLPGTVATCFRLPAEPFPEPLLTLWEPVALPLLEKFAGSGRNSPRDFLKQHKISLLTPSGERTLANINSPEEYQHFTGKRLDE
jgi:molybdopterin-guanine dinucleotide biosynthesis protein A